jgi:DNA-binding response OmpR family regulator
VDLTPTEFKLLATLIRRKGHLFTREQLLDAVWGVANYPTDRVIDNHRMNLRRKIERRPDAPRHLISARGLGYRFED